MLLESMNRPTGNHVLIEPDREVSTSIIIRAGASIPNTGKILALSPDYGFEVAVGDHVRYNPPKSEEYYNSDGTVFISEDNILWTIND